MVKPVKMTMQEILGMWLEVGHKFQKHPPDGKKGGNSRRPKGAVISMKMHIY